LCHVIAVVLWGIIPIFYEPFGMIYSIGVGSVAMILMLEHCLVMPRKNRLVDVQRINVAFFHLNVLVSVGFSAIGIFDIIRQ
jgi:4-hydroxybenzoate polyprenyltransferase